MAKGDGQGQQIAQTVFAVIGVCFNIFTLIQFFYYDSNKKKLELMDEFVTTRGPQLQEQLLAAIHTDILRVQLHNSHMMAVVDQIAMHSTKPLLETLLGELKTELKEHMNQQCFQTRLEGFLMFKYYGFLVHGDLISHVERVIVEKIDQKMRELQPHIFHDADDYPEDQDV